MARWSSGQTQETSQSLITHRGVPLFARAAPAVFPDLTGERQPDHSILVEDPS